MNKIRIVIADDHPLFRQGVAYTLSREADMAVVGEASSGRQALELARIHTPDVLLLDITMPEGDGLTTAAQIAATLPDTQIVMLTASEEGDDLVMAMKVGARGYVVKGAGAGEVVAAVRAVAQGEAFITPKMAGNLLMEMTRKPAPNPLAELTEREREVLDHLAQGMTNREIGQQLSLAEKTVKHYVTAVLQKLHVRSRVEAALFAQKTLSGDTL
jgi:two-component system, NarL family, nitrate/nitrite response regulator NarL